MNLAEFGDKLRHFLILWIGPKDILDGQNGQAQTILLSEEFHERMRGEKKLVIATIYAESLDAFNEKVERFVQAAEKAGLLLGGHSKPQAAHETKLAEGL